MPRISLRAYEKQIEEFIEQNRLQEAVDQCRNILMEYPKCISTYRILGKSLLEGKQFEEGEDIFNRVLAVFPDDFIAHVGMSMVKENANDLDAAIWHMELAFDNQPSNISIQEELKRLFGRRDGNHPAKIRLTRGALVRMYARGELFPQAIAEINSALQEDPKRIDLKVLLAKMYFLMGDSTESLNLCNELIVELPYCYEINKILVALLPSTNDSEKTAVYMDRLIALNPYEAFVGEKFNSDTDVPDDQVMLDLIENDSPSNIHENPDWIKSVGSNWEDIAPASSPEWLPKTDANTDLPTPKVESPIESPLPEAIQEDSTGSLDSADNIADDNLPDWMRNAGWLPSDENIQPSEPIENEPEPEISSEAEDLPDWLQSLSPDKSDNDQKSSTPDLSEENPTTSEPLTDALEENIISEPTETASEDDLPDWLKNFEVENASETNAKDDLPDWMKNISSLDQTESDEANKPDTIFKDSEPAFDESSTAIIDETPKQNVSQPDSIDPSTHVLDPNILDEDLTNNTAFPDLHSLPENWQSNLAEEKVNEEKPTLDKDNDVPEWVRSIIDKEPSPIDQESTNSDSAEIKPVTKPLDSTETQPTVDTDSGALTEKSGDDLLSWLRDLKPVEDPTLDNPHEDETPNSEDASETTNLDDGDGSPLDRLDQLTSEESGLATDNPPLAPETEPTDTATSIVPDDSDAILASQEPVKPETTETIDENIDPGSLEHQPITEPDLAIEPSQTPPAPEEAEILQTKDDFSNQLLSLNQQIITGDSLDTAIDQLAALSISNPDNYLVWQLLGDAYAKSDNFTNALASYNKAEELILKPL